MDLPAGYSVVSFDTLDSTNREALRRINAGAAHGTVVIAATQTDGRGRMGRSWASPAGNLYASLIVRPDDPAALAQLSFVAALGAGDALRAFAPVRHKWPNDLLLDGSKVGGILIEAEGGAAAVGIGINLASAPAKTRIPAGLVPGAPPPARLLPDLCARFDEWYRRWRRDGFAPIREAWLVHAEGLGETVEARLPGTILTGTFRGLDADGALLLEGPDGSCEIVRAGDVSLGRP